MNFPFINNVRYHWDSVPADLRRNLLLDFSAAVLIGVFLAAINTFVPVVARRLGADAFLLSFITAAPAVGNIIAVLAAHYTQQRRKLPFMVAAWTIGRGLFLLTPFVVAPLPFVLLVCAHWLIVSLSVTGYVEIMRAIYPAAIRGRAMAYVRVGFTACATILTPIIGQLLDVWSYQLIFPIAALFGILSGVTFGQVRYADTPSKTQHDLLEPWRIFWRDKRYRDYSIAFSICGFGNLLIAPLIPILLVDELRLNYGQVGWLGMINSLTWMTFYLVWGRLVDRRGGFWAVQINFFLMAFIGLAFGLATDMWLASVAYIIAGIVVAGSDLGWLNAVMQFARQDQIGHYTALHAFLLGVRGIVAPLLGTVLMTIPGIGLRGVFFISTVLVLFGWWRIRHVTVPAKVEAV
ncbi:MAG: MFS transporter [Chloroflexi bacterium]|nr:MFS transporter [Chloroflexota bacterium]